MLEGPAHEDHEPLDQHDGVARERGDVERQLGAALVESAEQDGGRDDPDRVAPAHQRHRVA